jgi:group I intron endonuclease
MKSFILKENKNKTGIYRLVNISSGNCYVGQSINLTERFRRHLNISYISKRKELSINRALLKYGYSDFSLEILEYCDKSVLQEREQYYIDKLNPSYNILKIAGSSLGFKHSESTKLKKSMALKGVYVGEKSSLFGRVHTEETKKLMSSKKAGDNNPLFGKTHSDETKQLMRLCFARKLGRVHSEVTKELMSKAQGNSVNIYEKDSEGKLILIGAFVSTRKAAKFLGISAGTVTRYMQSGKL